MTETVTLAPHDAMPGGRSVVVMRSFREDDPHGSSVQIVLTGTPNETTHPRRPDGTPMPLEEAIAAARRVAESEGLKRVYVLDRLAGRREKEIAEHDGDHSVGMDQLSDTDEEDAATGSDMRDVLHRGGAAD